MIWRRFNIKNSSGYSSYNITISLTNSSRQEMYTFGIYGRDFNLDGAAGVSGISSFLIVGFVSFFGSVYL